MPISYSVSVCRRALPAGGACVEGSGAEAMGGVSFAALSVGSSSLAKRGRGGRAGLRKRHALHIKSLRPNASRQTLLIPPHTSAPGRILASDSALNPERPWVAFNGGHRHTSKAGELTCVASIHSLRSSCWLLRAPLAPIRYLKPTSRRLYAAGFPGYCTTPTSALVPI